MEETLDQIYERHLALWKSHDTDYGLKGFVVGALKELQKRVFELESAHKEDELEIIQWFRDCSDLESQNEHLQKEQADLKQKNEKLKDALVNATSVIEALISSKRVVNLDEALAFYKSLLNT